MEKNEREILLEKQLNDMVLLLNQSFDNQEVILAHDWNEELKKLGVKTVNEKARIIVNERI